MSKPLKNNKDNSHNHLHLPSDLSQALIISERRRQEIQRLSGVGYWELDHTTGALYWSEEIYSIYNLQEDAIKPSYELWVNLIYEEDRNFVNENYQDSVNEGTEYNIRYRIKAGDSIKWIEARGVTYYDQQGQPERSIGTAQDISEIKASQEQIEHLAYHDMLTGLANRKLFSDKLASSLLLADQHKTCLAVLFIDLDNFKFINDQYGHDVGDEVLVGVARKLKGCESVNDIFARIGGDEFAGVLFGSDISEIKNSVDAVKKAIDSTYETTIDNFKISASIGVTTYPKDNVDTDILLRHADHAMYEAKEQGKSGVHYFDIDHFQSISSRRQLLKDIKIALLEDEFEIYYQPRIRLNDGRLEGAEALLRWFRPHGPVGPTNIVTAIKNTAEEWTLDAWVIKMVLSHIRLFKEHNISGPFGLNINPSSLQNPELPKLLSELLSNLSIAGSDVEIEILEMESIENFDTTRKIIHQCMEFGVHFSLDDFGTGYASLTRFHDLPISKLKIDQQFIKNIDNHPNNLSLVKSILAIANANSRPVVAEGVESNSIAHIMAELKCEFGQGYGIAVPMPMADFIQWSKRWEEEEHELKQQLIEISKSLRAGD